MTIDETAALVTRVAAECGRYADPVLSTLEGDDRCEATCTMVRGGRDVVACAPTSPEALRALVIAIASDARETAKAQRREARLARATAKTLSHEARSADRFARELTFALSEVKP